MTYAARSEAVEASADEPGRFRKLSPVGRFWLQLAAVGSVLASIYIIFGLGNVFGWFIPLETQYFYVMLGLLLPLAFLVYPATKSAIAHVPWYDIVLAAASFGIPAWFVFMGNEILDGGWEYTAPQEAVILCYIFWALILEAGRRAGGMAIFLICLVISLYPVFMNVAPGFLSGNPIAINITATFHVFGTESILGIPMTAFANLVVGFLVFGVALQYTGGGAFFLNLAFALLGKRRGGPAKVAIFASGLMGSMSGSVITNVLTTGVMTIPAMKRVGFRPTYAAGVEACASTGGVLMPPVMGATAFVMATFIEVPYSEIIIAAAFPSLLYYLGLFMQIDAYSARHNMKGLPAEELPSFIQVLKEGWYFIAVFVLLIVMLLYMQREAQAPYYATALLIAINQFSKQHRWNFKRLMQFVEGVGLLFAELAAILAAIGLIIGALTLTGKIGSITYTLVALAGDSVILLLVMGALTSFVLGIGMTVTAAYLFLAVTLAPALTQGGLNVMAVHLFMLYWGMISFITPPVAIGAFAAASVAGANGMKTGFEAMRLGSIIYFVPFFFVLNPALIGIGTPFHVSVVFGAALIGVVLISASLQGYLIGAGTLSRTGALEWPLRVMLFVAGLVMALPGGKLVGFSNLELNSTAAIMGLPAIAIVWWMNRNAAPAAVR